MDKHKLWILQVALLLMVTKVTGLLRDLFIPRLFGINEFSDAFFIGLSIVLTLYALIGKAITLSLIPKLKGNDSDYTVIKGFLVRSFIIVVVIMTVYLIRPHWFLNLLVIDGGQHLKIFVDMSIYALPMVPLLYGLVAFHQVRNRFFLTHFIGLIFNGCIIMITVLHNPIYMPWSLIIGMGLQILPLLWSVNLRSLFHAPLEGIKVPMQWEILWIVLVLSFEQMNVFINRRVAAGFENGVVTALDLGSKLSFLFLGVAVMALTTVLYPKLSQAHQENNHPEVDIIIKKMLGFMTVLSGFATIVIILLGEFAIRLLLGDVGVHYDFLVNTLKIYALLLLPLSLREVLLRYMFLEKKGFIMALLSVVCLVLNSCLSIFAQEPEMLIQITSLCVMLNVGFTMAYYIYIRLKRSRYEKA